MKKNSIMDKNVVRISGKDLRRMVIEAAIRIAEEAENPEISGFDGKMSAETEDLLDELVHVLDADTVFEWICKCIGDNEFHRILQELYDNYGLADYR